MPFNFYFSYDSTPSRAVWALAKYLGIDFTEHSVNFKAGGTKTTQFLKMNPSHTVPTITDTDENGQTFAIFESRAILQYLVNRYAPGHAFYPEDPKARAQIDQFLYWDASAYGFTVRKFVKAKYGNKCDPIPESLQEEMKDKQEILHQILGEQPFLTGTTVTIADICLAASYPWLEIVSLISPQIEAWYQRVLVVVPQLAVCNDQTNVAKLLGINK